MNNGLMGNPVGGAGTGTGDTRVWCKFKYTAANGLVVLAGCNIRAVARNAAGDYTVTFVRPFSTPHFSVAMTSGPSGGTLVVVNVAPNDPSLSGSKRITTAIPGVGLVDPTEVHFQAWGDQ